MYIIILFRRRQKAFVKRGNFRSTYYYNTPFQGGTPCWNGNISTSVWDNYMGFSYAYDNLSRLTQADNFLGWNNFSDVSYGVYNSSYTYDKQGNIKYLSLTEDVEKLSLSMTYSGNQLQRINDWTAADPDGEPDYYSMFTDYSNTPNAQYTYNKNDAMTSDPYKSAQFSYSDWGILRQVSVPAIDGTVDYKYSATGEKAALPA